MGRSLRLGEKRAGYGPAMNIWLFGAIAALAVGVLGLVGRSIIASGNKSVWAQVGVHFTEVQQARNARRLNAMSVVLVCAAVVLAIIGVAEIGTG